MNAEKTETKATKKDAPTKNDPMVSIEILDQNAVIDNAHHAKGKVMQIEKSRADVLLAMNPPAAKIVGV
ncbi:hypothetical protein JIN85_16895 [Luteolibacter pohnpeiensis]|uniref:Fe/B12 periplasmic-binding domain-containing protein n=1 Tax=Luteolibacter pohnpeiensis TaxID=454153 RepID=A0A934S9Z8_9BACT|nr:hypothetical protein [Luteolibacter pohnpeiensis]MBK1884100.1 hypothetical protein [Luteolibacter pohnpeiensis]